MAQTPADATPSNTNASVSSAVPYSKPTTPSGRIQYNINALNTLKNMLLFLAISNHTFAAPNPSDLKRLKYKFNCMRLEKAEWKNDTSLEIKVEYPIYSGNIVSLSECRKQIKLVLKQESSEAELDRYFGMYKDGRKKRCVFSVSRIKQGVVLVNIAADDVWFVKPLSDLDATELSQLNDPSFHEESDTAPSDDEDMEQSLEDEEADDSDDSQTRVTRAKVAARAKNKPNSDKKSSNTRSDSDDSDDNAKSVNKQALNTQIFSTKKRVRTDNDPTSEDYTPPTKKPRLEAHYETPKPPSTSATIDFTYAYAICSLVLGSDFQLPATRQELGFVLFDMQMSLPQEKERHFKASFQFFHQVIQSDANYQQLLNVCQ